jgi:hypothetical protein
MEKRKKTKSGNKTQQNKGTKTRTRVVCARAFFIRLSLSVPRRSPRSKEYSIPGERAPHPCVGWMKKRRLNFHGRTKYMDEKFSIQSTMFIHRFIGVEFSKDKSMNEMNRWMNKDTDE